MAEAAKGLKDNFDRFEGLNEEETSSLMEEYTRLLDAFCQSVGTLEASAKSHSVVIT